MNNRTARNMVGKYTLAINDHQILEMPKNARILSVQNQFDDFGREELRLWALIEADQPLVERRIRIVGTGNLIAGNTNKLIFLGTVQQEGGALVWHVFEDTDV